MCCCIPCCCCCCIPTIYRFAIAVGVAAFFTIVSLFSPGWGLLDVGSCAAVFKEYFDYDNADSYTIGLITNRHGIPTFSFEKYCTAAMFLALISEAAILVLITLVFFNLKHTYMPPTMMLLSASATFWLLTVAIVYPAKYSSTYKAKFGVSDLCTKAEHGLGDDYNDYNDLSFTPSYSYGGAVWSLIMCIVANIYGLVMLNEIYMWRDFSDFGQNRNQNWGWNRGNQNMNQGNMNWNGGNQNMNMTNMNCGNPNMGPGNMNWNGGNPNMGPGNMNWNGGNPNMGPGNMNWNGGNPNMGNMNYGGNSNMGPGNTNFGGNPNPGNMNMGKDNFGQGMGNPC